MAHLPHQKREYFWTVRQPEVDYIEEYLNELETTGCEVYLIAPTPITPSTPLLVVSRRKNPDYLPESRYVPDPGNSHN
jgi:hypothetical protein